MVALFYRCDSSVNKNAQHAYSLLILHTFYAFFIVVVNRFTLFIFETYCFIVFSTIPETCICKFTIFVYCRLIINYCVCPALPYLDILM